jgi:alpha-L-rhamnosidase
MRSKPPPFALRCEYAADPVGVGTPRPRFFWLGPEGESRGTFQSAYRIIVSSAPELADQEIGDCWDSGRVESGVCRHIPYDGISLKSWTRYHWKVRCWMNNRPDPGPWSRTATFVTGRLQEKDWDAVWIGMTSPRTFVSKGTVLLGVYGGDCVQTHGIFLRREFSVPGPVSSAWAAVSGLGCCEFSLNGRKVGDRILDPGWTDYTKSALYSTYDVASLLRAGSTNAAGILLGNGRYIANFGYGPPRMTFRMVIVYADGRRELILSDGSWKTSHGALLENGLYFGEVYDAREYSPGWDEPGFNDERWEQAAVYPGHPLTSTTMPPIRVTETIFPRSIGNPEPGTYVFDFGQNFSGWTRLSVRAPQGTAIRIRHAELIDEAGRLNTLPNENACSEDIYICRGEGTETHEPRFTYHGFRYAEISGHPGPPSPATLVGKFVHTDVRKTGTFFCSDPLVNRIHRNILWGQQSNLMSIPTDCPQRDERHGWLGDAHLAAEESVFNFDMAAFYTKFLEDIRNAQKDDGSLPDVVPPYLSGLYPADPAWGSAFAVLLHLMHRHYGDIDVLARHYDSLKKYVEFLRKQAEEHIQRRLGKYGDWCPPGSIPPKKTPLELTSTWCYYHDVRQLAEMAGILGRKEDAASYIHLAAKIRSAFNDAFLHNGQYQVSRISGADRAPDQTANILPLYLEMVPKNIKPLVLENLVRSVVDLHDHHLDTGILGTRYLLDVLTENGYVETAWKVVTRTSYPGWGYMVREGATTLWERWENRRGTAMNSHNHIMLGSVDAWFYRVLAGIAPLQPGWKLFCVRPAFLKGLSRAEASLETISGRVVSAWRRRDDGAVDLDVSAPPGTEAEILLRPLLPDSEVFESSGGIWLRGCPAEGAAGISEIRGDGNGLSFRIGSGDYCFKIRGLA